MEQRHPAFARRVYSLLLRAYPRSFRIRYGALMADAFVADRRSARRAGRTRARFWTGILVDTLRNATAERASRLLPGRYGPALVPSPGSPRRGSFVMLHDLVMDLRFGIRSLRGSPAFTAVSLLILVLGIGGTTTVFTLVNQLFLSPPPLVERPDELVRITRTNDNSDSVAFSYPDYEIFRDRNRTFASMYAYEPGGRTATVGLADARRPAEVSLVTANYFDVLGIRPALGRTFMAGEDSVPRRGAVVVVSDGFWREALGADRDVVGQEIVINGSAFTVVGVAPRGFRGASPLDRLPELWVPVSMQPVIAGDDTDEFLVRREGTVVTWLWVVGRLTPERTLDHARTDLDAVTAHLEESYGDWNEGRGTALTHHFMFQPSQRQQLVYFARLLGTVVALVLLIVCANVAIMQLARGAARQREIGIRAALGAGRGRVVRQLLAEGLLIAAAGAAGGTLLAAWLANGVAALIPVPITAELSPDVRVLAFAALVATGAALLFGLAPALVAARGDVVQSIGSRRLPGGRSLLRSGLVVLQIAASLVLVTGAMLFVRSLLKAEAVDPGFATADRVFLSVNLSSHGYSDDEGIQLVLDVLARMRTLPAVDEAAAAAMTPFRGRWSRGFDPDADEATDNNVDTYLNAVTPNYFRVMGIDQVAGRDFADADLRSTEIALVVNRATAEALWPQESPLDRTIAYQSEEPVDRIVGVVANSNYSELGETPQPVVYMPLGRAVTGRVSFAVSTHTPAPGLTAALRAVIHEIDPDIAITHVHTIEEALASQMGAYRLGARAVGAFGMLAALLAAAGLYGVLSYFVAGQTREIGVRMALGDTAGRVVRAVIGRSLRLVVTGSLLGIGVAALASSSVASMLYGVEPHDPISFALVPFLLALLAVLAALIPARRAARVNPVDALRAE